MAPMQTKGVKKYPISISDYRITRTLVDISDSELDKDLNIQIKIESSKKGSDFTVLLTVIVLNKDKTINIDTSIKGWFSCSDDSLIEKIPNFMQSEAPAILYPYLRSHISSLTSLANIAPIVLPIISNQDFKKSFEKETKEQ